VQGRLARDLIDNRIMKSLNTFIEKRTTEDPDLAERFNRVLGLTVEAMEESGIRYMFIGGIASGGLGRPRSTHDIDLFVVPEEAELALRALTKKGFKTEKTDPSWLYKGFKEDILVDVIFKSKGEIYLDTEMYQRMITAEFHGRRLRLVAPEDLLIIKAAAHSELTPSHWHDAIALLSYANIDWQYLIRRARRAPRRILSLLLYAQSNDIWVPNSVIHELYSGIFENVSRQPVPPSPSEPLREEKAGGGRYNQSAITKSSNVIEYGSRLKQQAYGVAHLRERLAEDSRTNELDIQIEQAGDKVLLRGEVQQADRKEAVGRIAAEAFPNCIVENQIRVSNFSSEPVEAEDIK
jgi:predicted nucleotidyltransferase